MSVTTFAAAQLLRLMPRSRISRAVGWLCEHPLPPKVSHAIANAYIRAYGVDMTEVTPNGPYASFDAFFTRALKDGARAISDAPLVSPADGLLVDCGRVDERCRLSIKTRSYSVGELIDDAVEADHFGGGSYLVVYLSPRDYHRVHSPVDGQLRFVRAVAGDAFPVNAIGERHVPRLFVRNQRAVLMVDTEKLGRVAVVMVGAFIVGRITVNALPGRFVLPGEYLLQPSVPIRKGEEIGMFHLGSTVAVLTEKAVAFSQGPGPVRYGQALLDE